MCFAGGCQVVCSVFGCVWVCVCVGCRCVCVCVCVRPNAPSEHVGGSSSRPKRRGGPRGNERTGKERRSRASVGGCREGGRAGCCCCHCDDGATREAGRHRGSALRGGTEKRGSAGRGRRRDKDGKGGPGWVARRSSSAYPRLCYRCAKSRLCLLCLQRRIRSLSLVFCMGDASSQARERAAAGQRSAALGSLPSRA